MNEELDVITAGKSLSWIETWIKAVTRPSVATYEEIISDPLAGLRRAYTWMIVSSMIGLVIYITAGYLYSRDTLKVLDEALGSMFLVFLCYVPLGTLWILFQRVIYTGMSQFIAGLLGGKGEFAILFYAFAVFFAPISIIRSLIGSIPSVRILSELFGLYEIFLSVIAVKAVQKFGWGRAMISCVPLWIFLSLLNLVTQMILS